MIKSVYTIHFLNTKCLAPCENHTFLIRSYFNGFIENVKQTVKKTFGIYIIRKLQKPGPLVSSELLVYWLIIYYENSIYIQLSGLDVLVKNNCVRDFSVAPDSVNWLSCSSNKPAIQDEVALFTLSLNTCCSINKLRCIGCFSIHIRMKNPRRLKNVSGVADVVCVCWVGGLGGGRGPRCCYLVNAATACRHWGPKFHLTATDLRAQSRCWV